MIPLDSKIISFIEKHHVMTLATVGDKIPHCSNLFYSWLKEYECFVFTSSSTTRHAKEAITHQNVAGSILLETKIVGKIRGIQLQGDMLLCSSIDNAIAVAAKKSYLKRFPYAIAMPNVEIDLWILKPYFIKYTDNTLGFGKKLLWGDEKF